MTSRFQDPIARFFADQQAQIVRLIEQAYMETGGHYAHMTADEQHRQAGIDSRELITALTRGNITQEEILRNLQAIPNFAVLNDVVHMAEALDRLFVPFVTTSLPDQPELAHELMSRMRNLSVRFRRNLAVAHLHQLAQESQPPATPGAPA